MTYVLLLSSVLATQRADTAAINRHVQAELARQRIPGLVDNHRLRLDDSIVRWFPEGAAVWQGITVRHLQVWRATDIEPGTTDV